MKFRVTTSTPCGMPAFTVEAARYYINDHNHLTLVDATGIFVALFNAVAWVNIEKFPE